MKQKTTLYLTLTTITPLFIGSGESMVRDVDFIETEKTIKVIDVNEFFHILYKNNPHALNEIGKGNFDLNAFKKHYNLSFPMLYSLKKRIPFRIRGREIKCFIKNGYNEPFIPGSSIKGSILRSLWRELIITNNYTPPHQNYNKFKQDIKNLAGDPHTFFARPLQVSDCYGFKSDDLVLLEVKVYSVSHGKTLQPKNFSIFLEAINKGIKTKFSLSLDTFLTEEDVSWLGNLKRCEKLKDYTSLFTTINNHSLYLIEREIEFFDKYNFKEAKKFYESLKNQIQTLDLKTSFITRVGWGVGWKFTTGDWLDEEDLRIVIDRERNFFRRVRPDVEFPKTRRLAIDNDGVVPLGWIKVEIEKNKDFTKNTPSTTDDKPRTYIFDAEEEQKTKIETFKKIRSDKIPAEIDNYLLQIRNEKDRVLQNKLIKILLEKTTNFSKALKKNKTWAKKLKALMDEIDVKQK